MAIQFENIKQNIINALNNLKEKNINISESVTLIHGFVNQPLQITRV